MKLIFYFFIFLSLNSYSLQMYNTGSLKDAHSRTTQYVCLAGGGDDNLWSRGWISMLQRSGGGDVVIIRTDGDRGGYESWIFNDDDRLGFRSVNSVKTIVIENAYDSNRPEVVQAILKAEMVFFAGGDQSLYIEWFRNSKLLQAVNYVLNIKKIPIGGTSAGMALMAGIDFEAQFKSPNPKNNLVTTEDVFADPTAEFVDLDRTVLIPPFMKNVITDTHFTQRDRHGRLMGFMARAIYNKYTDISWKNVKGIGADEGTAFCYDQVGYGQVYGAGNIYFLKANAPVDRINPEATLHWQGSQNAVSAYVLHQAEYAGFDLNTWHGVGGTVELWWIDGLTQEFPILRKD